MSKTSTEMGRALAETAWRLLPDLHDASAHYAWTRSNELAESPDKDRSPTARRAFLARWSELRTAAAANAREHSGRCLRLRIERAATPLSEERRVDCPDPSCPAKA